MLLAMMVGGVMMLLPQAVKAQGLDPNNADQTFDFESYANNNYAISFGSDYDGYGLTDTPKYWDNINGISMHSRFASATKDGKGWYLRNVTNTQGSGLWNWNSAKRLAICDMWNGDRVMITVVGSIKFVEANSAKVYTNDGLVFVTAGQTFTNCTFTFTAVRSGNVILEAINNYTVIKSVRFFNSGTGVSGTRGVSFTSPPSAMTVGDTYNGNNANVNPSWATPVFTSSDNAIVTVDGYGNVTAVGPGTATITAKLDIGPEGNQYGAHATAQFSVTVTRPAGYYHYNYDPAIEVYDLSGQASGTAYGTSDAGFSLNDREALYLTNLSTSLSLNNRIAVSQSSAGTGQWVFDSGLKAQWSWHNVSICNLKEGDRVRITYEGQATFSSKGQNGAYNGCAAFKDVSNDGDLNTVEGDGYIGVGNQVDKNYFYVITEDGHLDIGLSDGSKITKIEIYGDHQAQMIDRYANPGYTAYFSQTGQLMAKEHIVPGGLEVYVGNSDESQHAEVVMSDKGPVSFVYDYDHFKMARHNTFGSTNVWNELPVTGTYYKFVPRVNGTITVKLKANSINYKDFGSGQGNVSGNEVTNNAVCPYYFMQQNGNVPTQVTMTSKNNGADVTFADQHVTAGNTYYVYGWWSDPNHWSNWETVACGVAELIEVTFVPDNKVEPLALWVESVESNQTYELASVSNNYHTSDLYVKKMSDNITACNPFIDDETHTLKINGITFKSGANPGGTILIKIGSGDSAPVFSLTIAYDASWNNGEGHIWDFSTNPLNHLAWSYENNQFDVTPLGTGGGDDWTFAYRVKTGDNTGLDPMYLNNHSMDGNNANIIWDTEGLIIKTGSNQSAINNDYTDNGGVIDHGNNTNRPDPDRYVGILPGGEFRIPNLNADDRVIIYMGSGSGSGTETIYMDIINAKDAVGTPITTTYHVGGSLWQADSEKLTQKHGTPYYKGAYHFIAAADGDMIFKLENRGTLAKLYSIKIYTGKHEHTNDLERAKQEYDKGDGNGKINYNLNGYQFFNRYSDAAKNGCFSMHWRGKGEGLSEPLVVHHTGNAAYDPTHLFHGTIGTNHFIFYKSEKNQFGLLRIRVDVKDLNGTYATDYGLQNIVVGSLDKMNYPYTWDFTDLMKYAYTDDTDKPIKKALSDALGYDEATEFMDNAIVQWKWYDETTDAYDGYGLHLVNSGFSGEMVFPGQSQLYAGDQIIAETQGIDFIQMNTNQKRNGRLRITGQGLYLDEQNVTGGHDYWRIMIPEVPANAAVYIRAKQISSGSTSAEVEYLNGNNEIATKSFDYSGTAANGDYIYATKQGSTSGDMTFRFQDVVLQKIAVSTDAKQFNAKGWTTESRDHDIDPSLTAYMTGHNVKTYLVTDVSYANKTVELTEIGSNTTTGYLMHKATATSGDNNACVLRNDADEPLNIVNSSFHLFVPDMHDEQGVTTGTDYQKKNYYSTKTSQMRSVLSAGTIEAQSGDYWNYGLGYQYYDIDPNTGKMVSGSPLHTGAVAFYRIEYEGASSAANKGYLPVLMSAGGGAARFSIVFADGDENQSVGIVANETESTGNGNYYNLNGQRLNGEPSRHGLYIVNGKKMYVK